MNCVDLTAVWTLKMAYQRELWRLEDMILTIQPSAPPLDGMPHAASRQSKVEKIATKIADLKHELELLADKIDEQKWLLFEALNVVDMKPLAQRVLRYRYISCKSFNAIAKQLSYSRRQILRLHDEGLQALGIDASIMISFTKSLGGRNVVRKSPQPSTNAQQCHLEADMPIA